MLERKRTFYWTNNKGIKQSTTISYKLYFKENQLSQVVNQNGYTVEKNSECFEFFEKQNY